jgi:hypothetical protein
MAGLGNTGGGGGGGGAVRAGRAFVELFVNDNKVYRALDRVKVRFEKMAGFAIKAGASIAAAGAAALAPLTSLLSGGIDRAAKIGDFASIFGGTPEEMSKIAFAFEATGNSLEDMEVSLKNLSKANTSGKPLDEFFADMVDELNGMEPGIEKATRAQELFGRNWSKILDVGQDLRRLMDEAPLVSKEDADRAESIQQEFAKTIVSLKAATMPLLKEVGPVVKFFAELIRNNKELVVTVAAVAAGLVAAGLAGAGLGVVFGGLGSLIGIAVVAIKAAAVVIATIFSPIGVAVAVVAALAAGVGYLGYVLATETETGKAFVSWITGGLVGALEVAKLAWEGITAAFAKGDLAAAGEIALKGLEVVWLQFTATLTKGWNGFKDMFVDGWHELVRDLEVIWTVFSNWLIRNLSGAVEQLLVLAKGAAEGMGLNDLANKIAVGIDIARKIMSDKGEEGTKVDIKKIADKAAEEERKRKAARGADLKAAEADVDKAMRELEGLVDKAKLNEFSGGGDFTAAARVASIAGSRGTFSALQAGQLGRTDAIPKQQLEELKDINANGNQLVSAFAEVAAGMRLK